MKRRKRSRAKKSSSLKKNILIVLGVFLLIAMVIFGYFLGLIQHLLNQTVILLLLHVSLFWH